MDEKVRELIQGWFYDYTEVKNAANLLECLQWNNLTIVSTAERDDLIKELELLRNAWHKVLEGIDKSPYGVGLEEARLKTCTYQLSAIIEKHKGGLK